MCREKLASLQILRALAAWTVVFHHVMQLYAIEPETAVGTFIARHGSIGVDVFFVLSGFVMYLVAAKSNKGAVPFLIDRIFRVAPAYWFYSAMVVACIYLFPRGFAYTGFSAKSLLASALFIPHWNPSGLGVYPVLTVGWTLNFEMFFYFALACCMASTPRHFFKMLFVAFAILPLVYPDGIFFSHIAASSKLYEFLAGALLAICWTGQLGDVARRFYGVSLTVALAGVFGGAIALFAWRLTMPVSLSIVAVALLVERHISRESLMTKAIVRLGDESYSTYLVHCIVIGIFVHFTGKQLGQAPQAFTIFAITVATYLASAASYRWLERGKYLGAARIAVIRRVNRTPNLPDPTHSKPPAASSPNPANEVSG